MASRSLSRIAAGALAIALLAGCGSSGSDAPTERIPGRTLTIYVSVPLHGASAVSGVAIVNSAQMALGEIHARIGRYEVVLKRLDDSNPTTGTWDPGQTSNDAHTVAVDPTAIGYVGDPESGASAISIPVLNRAGIAQVSPTSTAVGLTSAGAGAAPGEPDKYYPTGARTFARVAPSDAVQAAVQVRLQQSFGCRRTYVVEDGEVDGEDLATSFDLVARGSGLDVVATQEYEPRATDYRSLAASIASTGARCVLISALADSNAVALTTQLAAALPHVRLFGGGGLADTTYARGLKTQPVVITSAALGAPAYPAAGRGWVAAYARRYGPPEPDAILGYEATRLLLGAVARASDGGRKRVERLKVVQAIFGAHVSGSVLGSFDIERDGDTSSRQIGVWIVTAGRLRFWKTMNG